MSDDVEELRNRVGRLENDALKLYRYHHDEVVRLESLEFQTGDLINTVIDVQQQLRRLADDLSDLSVSVGALRAHMDERFADHIRSAGPHLHD